MLLVILSVFLSPSHQVEPTHIHVSASEKVIFVWTNYHKIQDVQIDGLHAWTSFWSEKHPDNTWSVSLMEPNRDPVLLVDVLDPMGVKSTVRLDKYGYKR